MASHYHTFARPVTSTGKVANYAKLMKKIVASPASTIDELRGVPEGTSFRVCPPFYEMRARGFIQVDSQMRVYPTDKLAQFVSQL